MKTKAYLYIIASAVFWGLIGLFVRTLAAQGFALLLLSKRHQSQKQAFSEKCHLFIHF
jgi:hypothetical protein